MGRWIDRAGFAIGYGLVTGLFGAAFTLSLLLWVQGFALTCRALNP
jgi:hypothetical protein